MASTLQNGPAPDLVVRLGRARLKNPVLTASGTCGYGPEYAPYLDLSRLGGFTTKSVTLEPRLGNPPERIAETSGGLLNAIGLANVGLERFLAEKAAALSSLGTAVLVNVAGHSVRDYVETCRRLDPLADAAAESGVIGIELNVSCPNVADGLVFGTDPPRLRELVAEVRSVVRRGLLVVKLSPNVTDITATARAAIEGGAEALSLVNTFLGMAIDIRTWRPALANRCGGLSGPAIKPLSVYMVNKVWREVARDAGVPLIGMGGISSWQDAVEFLLAGATAVSIGTALFSDPTTPLRVIDGLAAYLRERRLSAVTQIVGGVDSGETPAAANPPPLSG